MAIGVAKVIVTAVAMGVAMTRTKLDMNENHIDGFLHAPSVIVMAMMVDSAWIMVTANTFAMDRSMVSNMECASAGISSSMNWLQP